MKGAEQMFNHRHYVPVLKWKQGEYQALTRLRDNCKDRVTPLIEIPPVGFDYAKKKDRTTIDNHLSDFGKRLRLKWQTRPCFVDLKLVGYEACLQGSHIKAIGHALGSARAHGCRVIPVVSLTMEEDGPCVMAIKAAVALDRRGVCLRLYLDDFDRPDPQGDIERLLRPLGVALSDVDLVLDFASPNYVPTSAFVRMATEIFGMVPNLNRWRSFTVVGSSYPATTTGMEKEAHQLVPRREWMAYKALISHLKTDTRIPTFGDYGIANPEFVEMDMRMIKPFAKLRYTIDDQWHIHIGTNVVSNGFGQYLGMCQELTKQPYFSGSAFSAADAYIVGCAAGTEPTGNLSTWVWVSTNRHVTKVVHDLSNLHVL